LTVQEAYAKARAAADRALALSPHLAAAHLARGLLEQVDFDWRGAEAELRRATELAPNDGHAKFLLGNQLAIFGELEPAIALTREALTTEPLQANWYQWLAVYLTAVNRVDEAERAIRTAIELQPSAAAGFYEELAVIEIRRGDSQAALASATSCQTPGGSCCAAVIAAPLSAQWYAFQPRGSQIAIHRLGDKLRNDSSPWTP
jgi:tetratricopeptide (TPR) repeat protein